MIPSALTSFAQLEQQLATDGKWTLFLDFDGTLTPIVSTPGEAYLGGQVKALLDSINRLADVRVAVVSGRDIDDLESRVELDLIYAGDHGLAIRGQGLSFIQPEAALHHQELLRLVESVRQDTQGISGVLVEMKGLSASVHYRNALEREIPFIRRIVERQLGRYKRGFVLVEGKKVFELRPNVSWNKGKGARWILEQLGRPERLAICIGDDETDEDIFCELTNALTIRVGAVPWTAAKYFLSSSAEVATFLADVYRSWSQRTAMANGGPNQMQR